MSPTTASASCGSIVGSGDSAVVSTASEVGVGVDVGVEEGVAGSATS